MTLYDLLQTSDHQCVSLFIHSFCISAEMSFECSQYFVMSYSLFFVYFTLAEIICKQLPFK